MTRTDDERAAEDYAKSKPGGLVFVSEKDKRKNAFLAGISHHEKKAQGLVEALEKISDPRKLGHSEPDYQTRYYCLINLAEEALKNYRGKE